MTAQTINAELERLSLMEQLAIIKQAIERISEAETERIEAAQKAEVLRRFEEIDNGTAVMYPLEEVTARLKEKYGI